jgi:pantoate--beta-alanine ligase
MAMAARSAGAAARPTLPVMRTVADLRRTVAAWRAAGQTVGLVPTMGALHAGHLALVRRAQADCDRTIVTLFVNPTQFGAGEDFAAYPRDEAEDRAKLATVGADLLYAPGVTEIYPDGFATTVTVASLTDGLCGPVRPGHFSGVATVVTKLLLQSLPDAAYFGEKDYQQLLVIRRLARDLDIPVRIEGVPTVRDADGLALSSRNRYLSAGERAAAVALPTILRQVAERLTDPTRAVADETARARDALLQAGFTRIDYVEVCDAETLEPLAHVTRPARILAAAWLGSTRLIDNMPVGRA